MAAAFVAPVVAISISACGGSGSGTTPVAATSNIVRPSEISRYPRGSVQRAFIAYWSSLQFQSWAEVAAYYDPRFRAFVGTSKVIAAKKINTTSFPLLKPTIVKVNTSRGDTTVYYTLRLQDGTKELASMAWRREGGNWQIIYDSRLDAELAQLAQDQVLAKDGSLTTTPARLPPAAVRAGDAAAQVQAHFLQEVLKTREP